jgi:hypothetical protein
MAYFIIKSMLSILHKPYPSFAYSSRSYGMTVISGGLVFAILFFLQPFDLENETTLRRFNISLSYAASTWIVCTSFLIVVPVLTPALFDDRHWTVGKELSYFSLMLASIAVCNTMLNQWLGNTAFSMSSLFTMTGYTLLVGMAPVTLSVLLKQQRLLRRFATEAHQLNKEKKQNSHESIPDAPATKTDNLESIILQGDNRNELLELPVTHFYAAEARDNYCNIYFEKEGRLQEILFRTTLKKLEQQFAKWPGLWRCHKSFLVNLDKVEEVSGNAQGYRLHFKNGALQVPVSRSMNAELKERWVS